MDLSLFSGQALGDGGNDVITRPTKLNETLPQHSGTFAMDGIRPLFTVLLFGHPKLLKRAEGGENGPAYPYRKPSLRGRRRSKELHFHRHLRHNLREPCVEAIS